MIIYIYKMNNNTTVLNDIESIVKDNYIYRFKNELLNCIDEDRKKDLKNIIAGFSIQKIEKKENKLDDYLKTIHDAAYKKNWSRLTDFHKKEKLIEYVKNLNLEKEESEKLQKKLLNKLSKNEISLKEVEYDSTNGYIISIKLKSKEK